MGNAPSGGEAADAQQRSMNNLVNPAESDVYENLSDYQRCTLAKLTTSLEIWKDVFHSKRLVTYDIFDDVFGHVLGDPDEHFPIFTGDDFKRRFKVRAAFLAAEKASKEKERLASGEGGGGSVLSSVHDGKGGPPPVGGGTTDRNSLRQRVGSVSRGSVSFGAGGMHGAFATSDAGLALMQAAQSLHKLGTTPFKKSSMIDVFEAFSVLCLLCDDSVEAKLTFLFMLFGRNSNAKTAGLAQIQFRDFLERLPSGVQKVMGFAPPEQKFVELATFALFGKSGSKDLLSFKEFWEWSQDEVEVAAYLQRVVQFSYTASSVYKQEMTVSTDQYLANSKLMEDDSDNEDENASGINRMRPLLLTALVKSFASNDWWEELPIMVERDKCLDAMRRMAASPFSLSALPVFDNHKRYLGLVDCMEITSGLIRALAMNTANNAAIRAGGRRKSMPPGQGATKNKALGKLDAQSSELVLLTYDEVVHNFLLESAISDCVSRKRADAGPPSAAASSSSSNNSPRPAAGPNASASTTAVASTSATVTKNPALTSQFAWSLIHRFACGERSIAIATQAWGEKNNDPVNLLHVMTPAEAAKWLTSNFSLLGERQKAACASATYCGVKIRVPVVVRQKDKAKDAFAAMVEHRADACAIVNEGGEFVGELWVEDILRIVRRTIEEGNPNRALEGDEWEGRVKEAVNAFEPHSPTPRATAGRSPHLTPVPIKVQRHSFGPGIAVAASGGRKLNAKGGPTAGGVGGNVLTPRAQKPNAEQELAALEAAKEGEIKARAEDNKRHAHAFSELNKSVQDYLADTALYVHREEAERRQLVGKEGKALVRVIDAFRSGIGRRAKANMEREQAAAAEKAAKLIAAGGVAPAGACPS